MLDSQEVIHSIDRRLAEARKEIASLESALTAMRKPSRADGKAATTRAARTGRAATGRAASGRAAAGRAATGRAGTTRTTGATRTRRANGAAATADQNAPTGEAGQTTGAATTGAATTGAATTGAATTGAATTDGAMSADGAAPATARTARTPRPRRTRRPAPKDRPQVVPAGKLVSVLGTGNGMSTSDLAAQTGGDRHQLLTLLRELEAAGEVRRSGERRNTRWHVITDEDRIAARVAELERQRHGKAQLT